MTNNIKKSIVFVYLEKSKSFGRFPLMSKRSFLEILVIYFKEHKRKLVFGDFHLFFILVFSSNKWFVLLSNFNITKISLNI